MSQLYEYDVETETPAKAAREQAEAFLRESSPESREVVLKEILKELIALNTDIGYIFLETADGEDWGVYLPPKAAEAFFNRPGGPALSDEEQRELESRLSRLHEAVPVEEALADLKRQELEARRELAAVEESSKPSPA